MTNAVYWCDLAASERMTVEDELRDIRETLEEMNVIGIDDWKVTTLPPLIGHSHELPYDILFFDWGGMSLGNSMMEHYCRYILDEAENHPSKCYVMVSRMTEAAMQDAMGSMSTTLANVFLELKDFARFYKTVSSSRRGHHDRI